MWHNHVHQKLVSFTEHRVDMERIKAEMDNGWHFISLVAKDRNYIGIMEKTPNLPDKIDESTTVFLPPRRRIKFLES